MGALLPRGRPAPLASDEAPRNPPKVDATDSVPPRQLTPRERGSRHIDASASQPERRVAGVSWICCRKLLERLRERLQLRSDFIVSS